MLCYENILLVVKEKQLNLMNHLGGIGRNGFYVGWLLRGHFYGRLGYLTCGRPPRNKEIGDTLFTSLPYSHMLYGLWLDRVCCEDPDPTGQVVVEGLL